MPEVVTIPAALARNLCSDSRQVRDTARNQLARLLASAPAEAPAKPDGPLVELAQECANMIGGMVSGNYLAERGREALQEYHG